MVTWNMSPQEVLLYKCSFNRVATSASWFFSRGYQVAVNGVVN